MFQVSRTQTGGERRRREEQHLIDADFSLNILETLLDDANEGSRRNQSSVDIRLTDMTLYSKGEG